MALGVAGDDGVMVRVAPLPVMRVEVLPSWVVIASPLDSPLIGACASSFHV